MKLLILIRGVPGSGKSTLAGRLMRAEEDRGVSVECFEADTWMVDPLGNYKFDSTKLTSCHSKCQLETVRAMKDGVNTIIVSNTFTENWELNFYKSHAGIHGYRVQEIICKADFGSVHNVPMNKVAMMKERFQYD